MLKDTPGLLMTNIPKKTWLVLGIVATVQGFYICPNYCETVACPNIMSCNGIIVRTTCGCCVKCATELDEGQLCLSSIFLGVPSNTACAVGLHCDPVTHRCIRAAKKSLNSCAARLHEIETSQQNGNHLLGVFKPTCTSDGYYAPVQCHGSVCYCATQTGEKIESYQVAIYMASQMTCQCARDKYEYMQTGLIGKMFYCDEMGSYQNSPDQLASVPCTQEKAEVEARLQQSVHNGMPLLGLEVPICTADGYYAAKQCRGSRCFCVNKMGASIGNYMVNRWEADDMNCQCARDQYEYELTGLIGKMFSCASNGNYAPFQCTGSVCYCVDLNGNKVGTTTVNIGMVGSLNC